MIPLHCPGSCFTKIKNLVNEKKYQPFEISHKEIHCNNLLQKYMKILWPKWIVVKNGNNRFFSKLENGPSPLKTQIFFIISYLNWTKLIWSNFECNLFHGRMGETYIVYSWILVFCKKVDQIDLDYQKIWVQYLILCQIKEHHEKNL